MGGCSVQFTDMTLEEKLVWMNLLYIKIEMR